MFISDFSPTLSTITCEKKHSNDANKIFITLGYHEMLLNFLNIPQLSIYQLAICFLPAALAPARPCPSDVDSVLCSNKNIAISFSIMRNTL